MDRRVFALTGLFLALAGLWLFAWSPERESPDGIASAELTSQDVSSALAEPGRTLPRLPAREEIPPTPDPPKEPGPPLELLPPHERHLTEIHGIVEDLAGERQAHAEVRFTYFLVTGADGTSSREASRFRAQCDGAGAFSIPVPRAGGRLEAHGQGFATVIAPIVAIPADERRVHRIVVAPSMALWGTVIDDERLPVPEARVLLRFPPDAFPAQSDAFDRARESELAVRTSTDGTFVLPDCPRLAGARIEVFADGFRSGSWDAPAREGESLVLELERLPEEHVLCGTVLDALGGPCAGAQVSLGALIVESGSDGRFCLDLGHPWMQDVGREAPAQLVAMKEGFYSAPVALTRAGAGWAEPHPLVLRLDLARLSLGGRVVDARGAPLQGLAVRLRDPTLFGYRELSPGSGRSTRVISEEVGDRTSLSRTDAQGRFQIDGLERRAYTLEVRSSPSFARVLTDPLPAGSDDVTIVFAPRLEWISGRVVDFAGRPLPGVKLSSTFDAGARGLLVGATTRSAEDGTFRLGPLGVDEAFLRIEGPAVLPVLLWPVPPDDFTDMTVVLSRRCGVRVDWSTVDRRATQVIIVDAQGVRQGVLVLLEPGISVGDRIPPASEDVYLVREDAAYAVALDGELELQRVPLTPVPDEVQVLGF